MTTPWRALARACLPDERKSSHVVPQQWLAHTTAPGVASDDRRRLDLVIYGATPLGGAVCCDATLMIPRMLGSLLGMGPCCKWQSVVNEPPTPSSPNGALSCACSDAKLADVGTPQQCRAWSRCAPGEPHRPRAAPPEQPAPDDGGACFLRQCSRPSATRH